MLRNVTIRTKLLGLALLSIMPLCVVWLCALYFSCKTSDVASEACVSLSSEDLNHVAQGVYALCETQQESLQQMVDAALRVAQHLVDSAKGLHLSTTEEASWTAINQFTQETRPFTLPRMLIGETWLGQNKDSKTPSLIVDEVRRLTGQTCTIFQRANKAGDMLRVCTNVRKLDGSRGIGTFIPHRNPDGTPNSVVETVLRGETYRGRAFVVNAWYITAYAPLRNQQGDVIGMLYVGVPQENVPSLRKAITGLHLETISKHESSWHRGVSNHETSRS